MDDDDMSLFDDLEQTIFAEIDRAMNLSADKMIKKLADEIGTEAAAKQVEQDREEIKQEIHQIREKGLEEIENAFTAFEKNKLRILTREEMEKLSHEFHPLPEQIHHFNQKREGEHHTLQENLEISDFVLYCFYLVGHQLFKEKHYDEASHIFLLLTTLNPFVKDYWMALGITEKIRRNFESSYAAFVMASIIDLRDPEPHFQMIECCLATGEFKGASIELEEVKAMVELNGDQILWQDRLDQLAKQIKKSSELVPLPKKSKKGS
jgi:tetratricopeptide (TPR) repeat protein